MSHLTAQLDRLESLMPYRVVGTVQGISGLTIEASDLALPLGALVQIKSFGGRHSLAEVIGFSEGSTLLMALSDIAGVARGDSVENVASSPQMGCSSDLLGRVLNGFGEPTDHKGEIVADEFRRIDSKSVAVLSRENIRKPISTSIRAIDGIHTCGLGQRMGIFSGPGVGKSTLMSSIARYTSADISVVALIGERGREVKEFLDHSLGPEGLKKCVVIVSTSDDPPLLRVRAAKVACTVAEYFRDQGKHVLLMMDSLTRMCQAQRQIGLAAKEPPATRGFPPSVFALIPEILERAGKTPVGSITGFFTVLVEGDDFNEPIPDAVKGITDGHLWLNRVLANRGHFPAIDPIQSISRVRGDVTDADQVKAARRITSLLAMYQEIEDLVNIGAYVAGVNLQYDIAVQCREKIIEYLKQEPNDPSNLEKSRKALMDLVAFVDAKEAELKKPKKK
jgi:FliI/YscN family ATPase